MSLLHQKQLLAQPVSVDPVDRFLQADVPFATLLAHGLISLRTLAEMPDLPFHLVTLGSDGELVIEVVDKIELLERTYQMGWEPSPAQIEDEVKFVAFDNATSHFDEETQHWWYAVEGCYEEWTGIPLCLPGQIAAARAEQQAREEAYRLEREQREEAAKAERARETARGHEYLVESTIKRHAKAGRTISREEAEAELEAWFEELRAKTKLSLDTVHSIASSTSRAVAESRGDEA